MGAGVGVGYVVVGDEVGGGGGGGAAPDLTWRSKKLSMVSTT